ncbi:MAG: hypothetical protein AB1831_08545 [Pseudomonadota bacterium]
MPNLFSYSVHGFTLHSEIACPELLPTSSDTQDVLVRYGSLRHIPCDETHPWKRQYIGAMHMLLNVRDVGRFSVRDGREITVDPVPAVPDIMLRLYLLGSALGCIIHQRGLLPLHANAVLHEGEAVLVLAHSGIGKSTLAAAMQNRGCGVLSDDVCAIRVAHGEAPLVFPGVPQIKLWKDAATRLGEDVNTMRRVLHEEEKYALPVQEPYRGEPVRIKALYILHACDEKMPTIHDMTHVEKIWALRNHTYRKGMVSQLGNEADNLKACAVLAGGVRIRRVHRPWSGFHLDELADLIEADLQ